ncbi:hypothetical protein CPT_Solent_015 [Salmonella phage Solent]|uniref:Uncharacterized protein n=1 Tax=Salmonella phage 9NA TaxID=1113547 RepID=A0A060DBB8_9CAUD|nr:hypothetical protein ST9NA_08 [Salmonella phage 9NA]AIB07011.1 hypothetical protein 9NA_08 [Salmonella phage 9NA]APU92852.1 hypothetical protein CPTSergei_15 [Salmonella phage vB_SenS_Sergei]AXY86183.1 hypothetical protein CPT_Solent_015 [Salmonella phage Solent]
MGEEPTATPWCLRLSGEDLTTIYAYQERPRNMALGQYSQLFMLSSWLTVQRALEKIDYQSRRGY